MRIRGVKGLVLGLAMATVAVVGLSCGGGGGTSGGPPGSGRTSLSIGVVVKQGGSFVRVTEASDATVYGVVHNADDSLSKVKFDSTIPGTYTLINPPQAFDPTHPERKPYLAGFFAVLDPIKFYQVCRWDVRDSAHFAQSAVYQFPLNVPFNATEAAFAPLTGPFTGGTVNDEGQVEAFLVTEGPPPLPDFP